MMRTILSAKTLVFDDAGRVLLLVRGDTDRHRPGGYDLPGGKVEDGEDYLDAALREALEEAGLLLAPEATRLLYATTKAGYNNDAGSEVNIVWLGYASRLPAGAEVVLSWEHSAFEWVSFAEAIGRCKGLTAGAFMEHLRQYGIGRELWDPPAGQPVKPANPAKSVNPSDAL